MSISWAYIFHAPGADPVKDRVVIERQGIKATLVPVSDHDSAVKVASELVASGVTSIEVCGAFGLTGANKVFQAVAGRAAVGGVTFGAESIAKVMETFMPRK
jgi:histidinol dehydrogenase